MANNVLVVAAHPDDEVLGCGATIARHAAEGARVTVLVLADGVGSRNMAEFDLHRAVAERRQASHRACGILGVNEVMLLNFPDNRMDQVALLDVVQEIEKAVSHCQPDTLYTHHWGDVNVDHRRVHDAAIAACRPQPGACVRQLLFFETPSSTEWRPPASMQSFAPNWFVDVTEYLPKKLAALAAYEDELRGFPHPRSSAAIEHLAKWRGAASGVNAAEAFEVGRIIV